jgi:5S rRNA maturation endonuclease (ribonuclease M5)
MKKTFTQTNFIIKGTITSNQPISKQEIYGSFYKQTKGKLKKTLELEYLFKEGKLGRISINKTSKKTFTFTIPIQLNLVDTSLIAANIESISIIGGSPCTITITSIINNKEEERKSIYNRAKELVETFQHQLLETKEKYASELVEYVPNKIYGSKNVLSYKEIILVEGRADVRTLHKAGIKNVLSTNGYSIPKEFYNLVKGKSCIAFMDGDSVGEKIITLLQQKKIISKIIKTPKNVSVEELSKKDILNLIKNKKNHILVKQIDKKEKNTISTTTQTQHSGKENVKIKQKQPGKTCFTKKEFECIGNILPDIKETGKFIVLNKYLQKEQEENISKIGSVEILDGKILIFDGIYEKSIDKKLSEKHFEVVVAKTKTSLQKTTQPVITFKQFEESIE